MAPTSYACSTYAPNVKYPPRRYYTASHVLRPSSVPKVPSGVLVPQLLGVLHRAGRVNTNLKGVEERYWNNYFVW